MLRNQGLLNTRCVPFTLAYGCTVALGKEIISSFVPDGETEERRN